jgi:hypothetical protein
MQENVAALVRKCRQLDAIFAGWSEDLGPRKPCNAAIMLAGEHVIDHAGLGLHHLGEQQALFRVRGDPGPYQLPFCELLDVAMRRWRQKGS